MGARCGSRFVMRRSAACWVATVVTKLQVPVMYAIFVLDFKILKWDTNEGEVAAPVSDAALHKPSFS